MPDEFTFASPEEFAVGPVLPPGMIRDLRAVASAEPAAVEALIRALRQESGILSEERLESLTRDFFDDDVAGAIARTIQTVAPEFKQRILAWVDRWRQASDEGRQSLPDAEFTALRHNLESLVQDYPGMELLRKARRLLRDTGNEIGEATFICDLRPVFDTPQKCVEGFVALTDLRIRYFRQSGERDVFEISLTEDELSMLIEQGQKALDKLKVLKETVHNLIQ